jgi:broad specificity phosphatase PhoE
LGWWLNHVSQSETRRQTLERIAAFTGLLRSKHTRAQRILIVSHGWYMQYLGKALHREGFRGSVPMRPHGGVIYRFED